MQASGWLQLAFYIVALALITKPMGLYLMQVLDANGKTWLDPVLRPLERGHLSRYGRGSEQGARLEAIHPRHAALQHGRMFVHLRDSAAAKYPAVKSARPGRQSARICSFNTATSFTTNTNWQSYVGETTMSYFSQMVGLAFHNFVSAATGIAIAAALVRGIARHSANTIGNFWVDLVRVTYYLLHPDLRRVRGVSRVAGHDPKLQTVHESDLGRADESFCRQSGQGWQTRCRC